MKGGGGSWGWKASVQLLSCVWLFATPWTAAHQASLSIINSRSSLKLMSFELVMSWNHLILCPPRLLLPSIFPSIRVFSNESVLCIRWPKYWSFNFTISPSNEYSGQFLGIWEGGRDGLACPKAWTSFHLLGSQNSRKEIIRNWTTVVKTRDRSSGTL